MPNQWTGTFFLYFSDLLLATVALLWWSAKVQSSLGQQEKTTYHPQHPPSWSKWWWFHTWSARNLPVWKGRKRGKGKQKKDGWTGFVQSSPGRWIWVSLLVFWNYASSFTYVVAKCSFIIIFFFVVFFFRTAYRSKFFLKRQKTAWFVLLWVRVWMRCIITLFSSGTVRNDHLYLHHQR